MLYLLIWAAPALILAGVVTGAFRATRTTAGIAVFIAGLMAFDAITGAHARATGMYCDSYADCPDANTALMGGVLAIAVLLIAHAAGRATRVVFDRVCEHDGIGHQAG